MARFTDAFATVIGRPGARAIRMWIVGPAGCSLA